jgi:hypothetical protein
MACFARLEELLAVRSDVLSTAGATRVAIISREPHPTIDRGPFEAVLAWEIGRRGCLDSDSKVVLEQPLSAETSSEVMAFRSPEPDVSEASVEGHLPT